MKIYTSYFGNLKNIPEDVVKISICGKCPAWFKGPEYKKLAPKYSFFMEWKVNKDNDYYTECFNNQVLGSLNRSQVYDDLFKKSNGKDVVILCYENPNEFCHRHLVSQWLSEGGIESMEWGAA